MDKPFLEQTRPARLLPRFRVRHKEPKEYVYAFPLTHVNEWLVISVNEWFDFMDDWYFMDIYHPSNNEARETLKRIKPRLDKMKEPAFEI